MSDSARSTSSNNKQAAPSRFTPVLPFNIGHPASHTIVLPSASPDSPVQTISYTPTLVSHHIGSALYRSYSFPHPSQSVLQAFYPTFSLPTASTSSAAPPPTTSSYPTSSTSFGPFQPPSPAPWTDDPLPLPSVPTASLPASPPSLSPTLVVFLSDSTGIAYPTSGGSIPFHVPFRLSHGICLRTGHGLLLQASDGGVWEMKTPGEELKPVKFKGGRSIQVGDVVAEAASDGGSSSPHIIVSTNGEEGKIAIWHYTMPSDEDKNDNGKDDKKKASVKGKEKEAAPSSSSASTEVPIGRGKRKRSSITGSGAPSSSNSAGDRSTRRTSLASTSMSIPPSSSELLDVLGETMTMKRTGSAQSQASALSQADRRGSVTRNELSITMDRMVLGAGSGAGEMEREPAELGPQSIEREDDEDAMVLECISEDVACDVALTSWDVFQNLKACIVDSRGINSVLAVHIPKLSYILFFQLAISGTQFHVKPMAHSPALAMTHTLYTRPSIQDLVYVDLEGNWHGATLNTKFEIPAPELKGKKVVHLDGDGKGAIVMTGEDGKRWITSTRKREDDVGQKVLEALAVVLGSEQFRKVFWDAESLGWEKAVEKLFGVVDEEERMDTEAEADDPWTAFLKATEDKSSRDPLLAALSPAFKSIKLKAVPVKRSVEREALEPALMSLHLLAEELKLKRDTMKDWSLVANVVKRMAAAIGELGWKDWYERATGSSADVVGEMPSTTSKLPRTPPDLLATFTGILSNRGSKAAPGPLKTFDIRETTRLYSMNASASYYYGYMPRLTITPTLLRIFLRLGTSESASSFAKAQAAVMMLTRLGWTKDDVESLNWAVRMPLREGLRVAQGETGEWPVAAYKLVGRKDLERMSENSGKKEEPTKKPQIQTARLAIDAICTLGRDGKGPMNAQVTPTTIAPTIPKATRFNEDRRLEEVARMLQYEEPVTVTAGERTLDQLTPQVQQSILNSLSNRTLALPVGYAIFHYQARDSPPTESVPVPRINTSARILPMPSPVALIDKEIREGTSSTSDRMEWPEFHSGVAAALQLQSRPEGFDSSQISFNKPNDLDSKHAGFLMGLGLMGRISSMVFNQAFEYLKMKHDPTSIGLLLGLAVTYIGTGDPKVTSLLSVHLAALHPPNSSPLNVSGITQAAGLVGVGLLYLGTARRTLADTMVKELCSIKVTSIEDPAACREAYALSAGFAFGMIMLGKGTDSSATTGEVSMLRTFRSLILGENNHPLPGATPTFDITDVNITSSGATLAIGLMYLRTQRQEVADMLEIPDTPRRLDYVRSDLLLLRTLARSLVMWEGISPSKAWVESHVPAFITEALGGASTGSSSRTFDGDLDVARWNIIAGACFAMGLKFAGTAVAEAHASLIHYLDRLTRAAYVKAATVQGKIKRTAIRACLSVVAVSLSLVMAGTGEINVLRRLRVAHGHFSEGVTYGTHLASHMALGMLFVGSGHYTLGTSNAAVAALLIAFFPSFPASPTENRAHLQAFRHLWTLAVEPRCLKVRDVDTGEPTFLPIRLRLLDPPPTTNVPLPPGTTPTLRAKQLVAPTLIPEIRLIDSIQIDSPRYWPFTLHLSNASHLRSFLETHTLQVKRRTGHLSYAQDPRGIKSIFTRSKSETGSSVFDFGETGRTLARVGGGGGGGLREFVGAFTDDAGAIAAVEYLTQRKGPDAGQPSEWEAFVGSVLLECLTRDKREIVAVYLEIYKAYLDIKLSTNLGVGSGGHTGRKLEDLVFVLDFYRRGVFKTLFGRTKMKSSSSGSLREPLVQTPLVAHVERKLDELREDLLQRQAVHDSVRSHTRDGTWPSDKELAEKVAVVLKLEDAPSLEISGEIKSLVLSSRMGKEDAELALGETGRRLEKLSGVPAWKGGWTTMAVESWLGA
ncbi:anaphase promoting complex subunit 1 [Pseudohyphozyma bogoriensis]|nr:anaphase promoting complex subunit 1 [Pseudohyphozyma bogoriensis]